MKYIKETNTETFSIVDIMGCLSGFLLSEIGGIYQVTSHLAGYPVMTHELPALGDEVKRAILEQHPSLKSSAEEAKTLDLTKEYVRNSFIRFIKDKHGHELSLEGKCIDTTGSHRLLDGKEVIAIVNEN